MDTVTLRSQPVIALKIVTAFRLDPSCVLNTDIRYSPGLADDCRSGRRTYQIRHEWPMYVSVNGTRYYDEKLMRTGYTPLANLFEDHLPRCQGSAHALLAARFNIPMNLGAGFLHVNSFSGERTELRWPEDRFDVKAGIAIDKAGTRIFGTPSLCGEWPVEIRTSVLAVYGRFDDETFFKTTYDPRHIVKLENKRPEKHADRSPKTFEEYMAFKDAEENVLLTGLSKKYVEGTEEYIAEARRLIGRFGWSTYDRTVMVLAGPGLPFAMEVYKFYGTTPPEIVSTVNKLTAIERPFIFGLTEGGSFGFGSFMDGRVVELGVPASYSRGPEGLFAMHMITGRSEFEKIEQANALIKAASENK